jgi:peptidoglycan/LPS O-acetylase OafA/YrhL
VSTLDPLGRSSLPALDGLRAIAVFLVIGLHLGYSRIPGYLGVLGFFVLSGFLITWLLAREFDTTGAISIRNFYCRRMLRIFPAFYCYLAVFVIYATVNAIPIAASAVASAFFYVSDYSVVFHVPNSFGLAHTWSLSVEEQFYLMWPWILRWQAGHPKRLARGLLCAIVLVQLWRPFLLYVWKAPVAYVLAAFDTQCDALLAGCLLAVLLKMKPASPIWRRLSHSVISPLAPLAALGGSFYLVWRWRALGLSIGGAVAPYAFAILILQLILLSDRAPWSWLNWPVLRYLGRISYPLYLYHLVTMRLGLTLTKAYPLPIQIAAGLAITIATASLSYFVVEKPFLRWKRRVASPSPAPNVLARSASASLVSSSILTAGTRNSG